MTPMPTDATVLRQALLRALAESPGGRSSLPRLGKLLGHGASVLMREMSRLGDAPIAGVAGPGWVRVDQREGRWVAELTDAGRSVLARGDAGLHPLARSNALP